MSLDYISEAFRSLESLNEEMFSTDAKSIDELSDFIISDDVEETISIIDMDAETEEDLQDTYVGKIICDCNVCHSHVFKDKDQITIDADGIVDIDDDCPYCGEHNGFVIIGEISEFNPNAEAEEEVVDEESVEEVADDQPEEVVEEEEEVLEESLNESGVTLWDTLVRAYPELEESLNESFNNVSIETDDQRMTMTSEDNGKVTVTTEPIEEAAEVTAEEEIIAPISNEAEDAIIDTAAEVVEEEPVEEVVETEVAEEEVPAEEEAEMEFEIDELDEEGMDELGESYLKRVYENVESFKTSNVSTSGNQLIIEGMINFKSGASKKTGFIFEAKEATKDGAVKFIGENAHFCRGKRAFTLSGNIADSKLMVESLTYNYRAKAADGKSTRVYGKVDISK